MKYTKLTTLLCLFVVCGASLRAENDAVTASEHPSVEVAMDPSWSSVYYWGGIALVLGAALYHFFSQDMRPSRRDVRSIVGGLRGQGGRSNVDETKNATTEFIDKSILVDKPTRERLEILGLRRRIRLLLEKVKGETFDKHECHKCALQISEYLSKVSHFQRWGNTIEYWNNSVSSTLAKKGVGKASSYRVNYEKS